MKNVGDPIYELRDNELLLGVVTNVIDEHTCDGKIKIIIPKDAFVEAYEEWIKKGKKSVARKIIDHIRKHF